MNLFTYQFGPLIVKVTFNEKLKFLEDKVKEYYSHALIRNGDNFDHHSHIELWEFDSYAPSQDDNIVWVENMVDVESKRNIKINVKWNQELNTIVNVYEGKDDSFEKDQKKYWEFAQRISIYPSLINKNIFMLHCAAIIIDEKVHIFLGPSGSGKSTLANKAIKSGYKVLTDDTAILSFEENSLMAFSAPYKSKSGLVGDKGVYEVSKFYLLEKDLEEKIEIIEKNEFLRSLQERIYEAGYLSHVFSYKSKNPGLTVSTELLKNAFLISKKYQAYKFKSRLESDIKLILN